jgi:hypothetical protein
MTKARLEGGDSLHETPSGPAARPSFDRFGVEPVSNPLHATPDGHTERQSGLTRCRVADDAVVEDGGSPPGDPA